MWVTTTENKLINLEQFERVMVSVSAEGRPCVIARSKVSMSVLVAASDLEAAREVFEGIARSLGERLPYLDLRQWAPGELR